MFGVQIGLGNDPEAKGSKVIDGGSGVLDADHNFVDAADAGVGQFVVVSQDRTGEEGGQQATDQAHGQVPFAWYGHHHKTVAVIIAMDI